MPQIEFPFYTYLKLFLDEERRQIYAAFKPMTKKFLQFNSPENANSFLRRPQFEALEIYVFLKEFCENKPLHTIFEEWFERRGRFENRSATGITPSGQLTLFNPIEGQNTGETELFREVFNQIKEFEQSYPNYIFALTMGLGKTILMATSIFYEFLLANKYPKDEKYCHNALVFAPDKTVLQSLREIESFDKSKVVPAEYVSWLETNLKFHYLDSTGDALNAIDKSKFNIIVSNTQKIILKRQAKEKSPSQKLFEDTGKIYEAKTLNEDYLDLYGFEIDTETDLITNQRFAKLTRLKQLGIYVDEAHHIFGTKLAKDFGTQNSATSLRLTINELAANLAEAGTKVVGCYNYTGTPYVKSRLLPEVVYSYGLRDAIDNQYLKKVKISGFENIQDQTLAFVRLAIKEFWETHNGKRYENLLPKIAFFASTIAELQNELRPAVEKVLAEMNIPHTKILVNVGDEKITNNDDRREFNDLDKPKSEKQFILLVNKGKEGWDCRSLFAVGLHRQPKSKIFVLQASMRCLRQISEVQQSGKVYLSQENVQILEKELEENLRLSITDLNNAGDNRETVEVRIVPPPVKIKLKRVRRLHQLIEKEIENEIYFGLEKIDTSRYEIIRRERDIRNLEKVVSKVTVTEIKETRVFSELTLVAEIARYLYLSPLKVRELLNFSTEGIEEIIKSVNKYNEILYDHLIPKLFNELYRLDEYEKKEDIELELIKQPKDKDYYQVKVKKGLRANRDDAMFKAFADKSFHLDNYCFDSKPENDLFWNLLTSKKIKKVWFTGMLTHGQTDFAINYIDPESHALRSYYPDFLVQMLDDSYTLIEVKGDNMIDNAIVRAKADYASQLAASSDMRYKLIKSSEVSESFVDG